MKTLKTILYTASLFIFWLILSGDDHPFAMALGFVISICIVWMNHKLIFDDHGRKLSLKKVGHLFVFIFVLIKVAHVLSRGILVLGQVVVCAVCNAPELAPAEGE